ncbi:MAG: M48 family metallopeptidase [Planctomycetales bacterium]|nr:M48 family metallopeptidase [Planctomycetales bacterium]
MSLRLIARTRPAISLLVFVSLVIVTCWGCHSVPLTGRKQLLIMPEAKENEMGVTAYQDIKAKEKPSTNREYIEIVKRVGERLAAVSGRTDYQWEFHVIASETPNAFCLPGGKVAFYEGIMPICANEAGVAVVMSHEISHALARHGGERMSQTTLTSGIGKAVDFASKKKAAESHDTIMKAYGVAAEYGVILPYSRKHESEADGMGILLMAKAGYDPSEAPRFWERFASSHEGQKPPEFFSTHPSDERRAEDLRKLLPTALVEYDNVVTKFGRGVEFAKLGTGTVLPAGGPSTAKPQGRVNFAGGIEAE